MEQTYFVIVADTVSKKLGLEARGKFRGCPIRYGGKRCTSSSKPLRYRVRRHIDGRVAIGEPGSNSQRQRRLLVLSAINVTVKSKREGFT